MKITIKGSGDMSLVDTLLNYNRLFVEHKNFNPYITSVSPNKKLVIVTCMDSQILELLPKALNIKNGDVEMIKTAGAIVDNQYDSSMRSILIALARLNAEEVVVIGKYGCGMQGLDGRKLLEELEINNQETALAKSSKELAEWLGGFPDVVTSVKNSVYTIRSHPLLPPNTLVHGFIMDPKTGELNLVEKPFYNNILI